MVMCTAVLGTLLTLCDLNIYLSYNRNVMLLIIICVFFCLFTVRISIARYCSYVPIDINRRVTGRSEENGKMGTIFWTDH